MSGYVRATECVSVHLIYHEYRGSLAYLHLPNNASLCLFIVIQFCTPLVPYMHGREINIHEQSYVLVCDIIGVSFPVSVF